MTHADAIAALETAKLTGDIAAIIAAADALAKAGSSPIAKPARKPRAPNDARPDWFTETAKAPKRVSRIKHSLAVTFADGQVARVNAWQVAADRPVAVGRALAVAIEFIRQRRGCAAGFREAVPAIESAQLVAGPNDGASFDGAECSRLTESARARIEAAPSADPIDSLLVRREWLATEVERRAAAVARMGGRGDWAKAVAVSLDAGRGEMARLDERIAYQDVRLDDFRVIGHALRTPSGRLKHTRDHVLLWQRADGGGIMAGLRARCGPETEDVRACTGDQRDMAAELAALQYDDLATLGWADVISAARASIAIVVGLVAWATPSLEVR